MTAALHLYIQLQDALTKVSVPLRLHLAARVLQDALTEATAAYWLQRAEQFEASAPQPGDHHGNASPEQLTDSWVRCMTTAAACRRHAELITQGQPEEVSDEVTAVLGEVA
jgi:hypothetical protein